MPQDAQKKKNMIMIAASVLVLVFTAWYLINNLRSPGPPPSEIRDQSFDPQKKEDPTSSQDIFSNSLYRQLEDFNRRSFDLAPRGRSNPFEPFVISSE